MEANLETPAESVEFCEYFHDHSNRVDTLQSRLRTLSKATFCIGALLLATVAYDVFAKTVDVNQNRGHPLLKASQGSSGANEMSASLNALSAMLWGLVVVKAK